MAGSIINNSSFHQILDDARVCTSKRGTALRLKIEGGVKCDTITAVKLTLISYLLVQYTRQELECLEKATSDSSVDYLEAFVNYIKKECRDCISDDVPVSETPGSIPPITYLDTQSGDQLITRSGNNIITQ
jgi:hypothetical protein